MWKNKLTRISDHPDHLYPLYGTGPIPPKEPGKIRIYVDGCFDLFHCGHINALRQARELGNELFLASHTDDEIIRVKGKPPALPDQCRLDVISNNRIVDYVIWNAPYAARVEDLELLQIDFVAHGDDVTYETDGSFSYAEVLERGMLRYFHRTPGISSTDIRIRLLNYCKQPLPLVLQNAQWSPCSFFSARTMQHFFQTCAPTSADRIVYLAGEFDLLNDEHIRLFKAAREFGTYLLIGVYNDALAAKTMGDDVAGPLLNQTERQTSLLTCRLVDDVLLDVPYNVPESLVTYHNVSTVICLAQEEGPCTCSCHSAVRDKIKVMSGFSPNKRARELADKAILSMEDDSNDKIATKLKALQQPSELPKGIKIESTYW